MDRLRIIGGQILSGAVRISGAKNAALPLMAASLLTDQTLMLRNVPKVADINTMGQLLTELGVDVTNYETGGSGPNNEDYSSHYLALNGSGLEGVTAPYELVRKMRASVLVLGPLLARLGYACVSMPGGCAIGPRPVDMHVAGLQQLCSPPDQSGQTIQFVYTKIFPAKIPPAAIFSAKHVPRQNSPAKTFSGS